MNRRIALIIIIIIAIATIVGGCLCYVSTPNQTTASMSSQTVKPNCSDDTLLIMQQIEPEPTQKISSITSPQAYTHLTNHILPSYVESRSVLWKGNQQGTTGHDDAFSYVQTNNHQPFSTQRNDAFETHENTQTTAQPRVNLWNSSWCGLYV